MVNLTQESHVFFFICLLGLFVCLGSTNLSENNLLLLILTLLANSESSQSNYFL